MNLCSWIMLGVFALAMALLANLIVFSFATHLRCVSGVPCRRDPADVGVPPIITGTIERVLAFALFFLNVSDAYTILALWTAAKLLQLAAPIRGEPEQVR